MGNCCPGPSPRPASASLGARSSRGRVCVGGLTPPFRSRTLELQIGLSQWGLPTQAWGHRSQERGGCIATKPHVLPAMLVPGLWPGSQNRGWKGPWASLEQDGAQVSQTSMHISVLLRGRGHPDLGPLPSLGICSACWHEHPQATLGQGNPRVLWSLGLTEQSGRF